MGHICCRHCYSYVTVRWLPMSSAPKDGSPVLLDLGSSFALGGYERGPLGKGWESEGKKVKPRGWFPIPEREPPQKPSTIKQEIAEGNALLAKYKRSET